MKVLHVIDSLFVGGAETLLSGLCSGLSSSGNSVEVIVLQGGGPLEARLKALGVPVHVSGMGSLYSPLHIFRLAKILRSRRFDILHVHLFPAQLWACLAVKIAGFKSPVVTTEHSTSNRRRTLLFRPFDRWMFGQFTTVVAISEATKQALLAHLGQKLNRLSVVPNGIDEDRFRPTAQRHSRTGPGRLLLTVGSLTKVKDQATAIRALALLEDVQLIIAGDGPLRSSLERLANDLGVSKRVSFLGVRQDIPELIASADLYVQTSRWEGFCLAAVEAMCGGLPCVASRVEGLQEILGPAGTFFEPGNAEELASLVRFLYGKPERRIELSIRSLKQAKQFSLKKCCASYEGLYRNLYATR